MTIVPCDVKDSRNHFALRFLALAERHGVLTNDLLFLEQNGTTGEPERSTSEQLLMLQASQDGRDNPTLSNSHAQNLAPSLIVPGLLGDSVRNLVAPLMCARKRLSSLGYDIEVAWVNGRAGCERNAAVLRDQINQAADSHGAAVNVIAYSKGCADCLHMLGEYPDTHDAVRSLVSLAGVVYGTPLARNPPWVLRKLLQYAPVPGVPFGDGRAIVDLSCSVRRQWMKDHPLPSSVYLATVAAAPCRARVSRVLKRSYDKLASINPANDSQVIDVESMLPGGELLAVVNADHWAVALPVRERLPLIARLLVDQNDFPRDVLLRALLDHLGDLEQLQSATSVGPIV